MQDFSKIKLRISEFLESKGINDSEFYRQTGITRGVLRQSNGISEDNLARFIVTYPEISLTWLLKGEGNMIEKQDFSKTKVDSKDYLKQLLEDHTILVDSHQKLTDAHYLLTVALTDKNNSINYKITSQIRNVAEKGADYKKE